MWENLIFASAKNKLAGQLRGSCAADKHLCFRYIDYKNTLNPTPLATFCECSVQFVSDRVGSPEDSFSLDAVHTYGDAHFAVLRLRGSICHMRGFIFTNARKIYYDLRVSIARFLITLTGNLDI